MWDFIIRNINCRRFCITICSSCVFGGNKSRFVVICRLIVCYKGGGNLNLRIVCRSRVFNGILLEFSYV